MAELSQDRLVRKEVALGAIREMPQPEDHVGLSEIAPFESVQSDDVIFEYIQPTATGLAPARAEDAESELARKDSSLGEGRASLVDWALKDHYSASDVTRYREAVYIRGQIGDTLPLSVGSITEDFETKLARDDRLRRRKLDNRIEWLIWSALEDGTISYSNEGVTFEVDFGRPSGQTTADVSAGAGEYWSHVNGDPINDILTVQEYMHETYGVQMDRAYCSSKVVRNILNSTKFTARSGLAPGSGIDPFYLIDGWGFEAARGVVERATGVKLRVYDAIYRTKPLGSNTITNNRFLDDTKVVLLPSAADVAEIDDAIGFAKTLTSPHPEGNFQTGFYEWERSTVDPWGIDRGTGVKAFPVFPHLDLTYVLKVLA